MPKAFFLEGVLISSNLPACRKLFCETHQTRFWRFAFRYSGLSSLLATLSLMPPGKKYVHCALKISSGPSLYLQQFLQNGPDMFPPHWRKSLQSHNSSFAPRSASNSFQLTLRCPPSRGSLRGGESTETNSLARQYM